MPEVTVRYMQKRDLVAVLEAEEKSNTYLDPDFDVTTVRPDAWTTEDYIKAVRQRKSKTEGTFDTRAWVAEVPDGEGKPMVVGAFLVELLPDGYSLLKLTVHPSGPYREVIHTVISKLITQTKEHDTRKKLTATVPDYDYEQLELFQFYKFNLSLHKSFYQDGSDAWICSFSA